MAIGSMNVSNNSKIKNSIVDLQNKDKEISNKIGTTDISSIGDGTFTGAINTVNSNLDLYKSDITKNFLFRTNIGLSLDKTGWYRLMRITVVNETAMCIRLNFSIGNSWWNTSQTYIDFDIIIKQTVIVKQNICIPSDDNYLTFDKFRVYYESTTKTYYIDVHYKTYGENFCGCFITNKTPILWNTIFYPLNFVSVDDTIPDTTKLKLEYSFVVDQ